MKTLENSQQADLLPMELPELTLSRADSRARTFQQQGGKPGLEKAQEADYGPKSSDLLASYDRDTSSWRTLQICLEARLNGQADGLAEFSETWPNAGMMRNGKTYRRQPWALPIAENASGFVPTPRAADYKGATSPLAAEKAKKRGYGPNLPEWVAATSAKMWPTPQASDNRDRGNLSSGAVKRRMEKGKQISLSQSVSEQSGALNPTWVEWLMGFPTGWTDLKDLETQ